MQEQMIYPASNLRHRDKWLKLREEGFPFTAHWLDAPKAETPEQKGALWQIRLSEAATCDALLFYQEPEDTNGGALFETGAALTAGRVVYYVGPSVGKKGFSILHHPLVIICSSLEEALSHLPRDY